MRRSSLLRTSSSQRICNFCACHIQPNTPRTAIYRSNGFHSTAVRGLQWPSSNDRPPALEWDLPDDTDDAQAALAELRRQKEQAEAERQRRYEETSEGLASKKLFVPSEREKKKKQTKQTSSPQAPVAAESQSKPQPSLTIRRLMVDGQERPADRLQARQRPLEEKPRLVRYGDGSDGFKSLPEQVPPRQKNHREANATRTRGAGPVDSSANRPLNRVQTAQREERNKTKMQDMITQRLNQDRATEAMPTLDSFKPSPMSRPIFQSAPEPKVKPPPSWSSATPSATDSSPSQTKATPSLNKSTPTQAPGAASFRPSQPLEDDIFEDDIEENRRAFAASQPLPDLDETPARYTPHVHEYAENSTSNSSQHNPFPDLSSLITSSSAAKAPPRPKLVTTRNDPERPNNATQTTPPSAFSELSEEEERMLEMLLARKNKLSAQTSAESVFDDQEEPERDALVAESRKRAQEEKAKKEEEERREQLSGRPRFRIEMSNNRRHEQDVAPFDPEVVSNWDILKSKQQPKTSGPPQEEERVAWSPTRTASLSAEGIDARFEEYKRRRPRYGTFDIDALNVEDRPPLARSTERRPERTCIRCGKPGHFFANCPNPPKSGWIDRSNDKREPTRGRVQDSQNSFQTRPSEQPARKFAEDEDSVEESLTEAQQEFAAREAARVARRAARFAQGDEDEVEEVRPTKARRNRTETQDEDDDKPRKGRRSRFDEDEDIESDFEGLREARAERKKARQSKKEKAAREAAKQAARRERKAEEMTQINLPEFVSVNKLAQLLGVRFEEFVDKIESLGFENTSHDHILSAENASLIAMEYNFDATVGENDAAEAEERDLKPRPEPEDKEFLPTRPPVVAIMGHVDHGKTTILDFLRKSSIAAGEHGGITQHIGAFSVGLSSGKTITFLDTPGHAAFLEMRKRGATVTDIIILVVAADDSVKPQTVEAIKHAKSANVPIIVAINKIDKEEANVERVKQDLARFGVEIEDYGGDTQVVPVSGKTGQGIDELEDAAVTLSEILDHRADTEGPVEGWVIEATTKKAGRVATVLVRRGTLKPGSIIVAGQTWARVRTLRNEAGATEMSAGPGTPIEVDGWRDQPVAGDEVLQAPNEQKASDVVEYRTERLDRIKMADDMEKINTQRRLDSEKREQEREAAAAAKRALADGTEETEVTAATTTKKPGGDQEQVQGHQTVPFIIKADVSGSVEAVNAYLLQMTNSMCSPTILRSGVGPVSEFDIEHAAIAGGHVIAFNIATDPEALGRATRKGIKIIEENVIYRIVDDVKAVLEDKLAPVKVQRVTGEAEVAMAFEIGVGGRKSVKIAGLKVRNGVVSKGSRVRVTRGDEKVFDGVVSSLKNVKKEVQEMRKGTECGMGFEGWEQFEVGDMIQTFEERSEKRKLQI